MTVLATSEAIVWPHNNILQVHSDSRYQEGRAVFSSHLRLCEGYFQTQSLTYGGCVF